MLLNDNISAQRPLELTQLSVLPLLVGVCMCLLAFVLSISDTWMEESMGEYRYAFTCPAPLFSGTCAFLHNHLLFSEWPSMPRPCQSMVTWEKLVPNYLAITIDLEGVGEPSKCLL